MGARLFVSAWVYLVLAGLGGGCASAPPNRSAVEPNEPWVYLHLVGKRGAVLQRQMDDDWITICRTPCRGAIPASGQFRIVGNEPSRPFTMPGTIGATVTLRAEADGRAYTLDSAEITR
jgi:hypothetical protein